MSEPWAPQREPLMQGTSTQYPAVLALQADQRARSVEAILRDLIAELREATGFANRSISFAQIGGMADRAEQRLKEVQGEWSCET